MPYVKKTSTFTEYKYAFLLLHSAKLNQEQNVEFDRSE